MPTEDMKTLTFCVCTYNSAKTLERCLSSIRSVAARSRILVVDHHSEDDTVKIARKFDAEIFSETKGLGFARQLCFDLTNSEYIVFVDGDVEIVRKDFFDIALQALSRKEYGAAVGMALSHRFRYGLPASLLVLRKNDFLGKIVPDYIDARETFFIQRRLENQKLRTFYVYDSMIHRSQFRKFKPEWEGANTRILPDSNRKELFLALKVIILLSLNSRNLKNILYIPIFYLKFLHGFAKPGAWLRMNRGVSGES
ncbi:MAG: glycosyltransferase family 2 protein [Candidatus Bathyarchaeia archaeon]